eukprot:3426504-Rhodomonas_salina.1
MCGAEVGEGRNSTALSQPTLGSEPAATCAQPASGQPRYAAIRSAWRYACICPCLVKPSDSGSDRV